MSNRAPLALKGFHHLTAVTADAAGNLAFYTRVLGLRLVKRTVNQDDVGAYHLYYADKVGTPGTDITFFDWSVPRESRGTRSISRIGFRVHGGGSLDYWRRRFQERNVTCGPVVERDGRATLDFEDPEGQRLTLWEDDDADEAGSVPWDRGPIPAESRLRGLGPITLSLPALEATHDLLTEVMSLRPSHQFPSPQGDPVHVYAMEGGGLRAQLHVELQPALARVRPGAGGVHHVAFRTPDDSQYHLWQKRLNERNVANSGEIDRFYFRSLYFREPAGILFEIATDGPGFAVDEDVETLGETVALPPFLEPRRAQILAALKSID